MRVIVAACIVFCASFVSPTLTPAQSVGEQELIQIDLAVANYLRPLLPKGGVVFEPRVQTNGGWIASRSQLRLDALATVLRATAAHHDSIYVCGLTPSDCTLRNTNTLIAFSEPVISGNTAIVRIERLDRSGLQRIPVTRRNSELRLVREGAGWRVVSSTVTSET